MSSQARRKLRIVMLAAGMILPATTCSSTDTLTALADLTASTSGSFVQILVQGYLHSRLPGATDPDLTAPIADQQH
jgi:hypothetical protein